MESLKLADGSVISFERYGSGPPLVLVHGSMSDHESNWLPVKDLLSPQFTVYAMDRRGRGETTASKDRDMEQEFRDVAALVEAAGQPAFVLGHSFGAHCAMGGAAIRPELVSKLVLYEPPVSDAMTSASLARVEEAAARSDWDGFVRTFLLEGPKIPDPMVNAIQSTPFWPPMVADGPATLSDIRTLVKYRFDPARFASLTMPVLLLVGSESPRDNYVTDTLAAVLPDARIVELQGQGHVAQALAPQMFVDTVAGFLLGQPAVS
jgi:pimeloyl-ACP methyl ester carboxylesterase